MLLHRIYYQAKPYLPWSLRINLRRMLARKKRRESTGTWPILKSASRPPANWPGWPGGKKFAFVITHDVESGQVVEQCRQLMELEKSYGFRSSFNFVPEGEYVIPSEFRVELETQGFEVGVHDLNHDGKLFRSRKEFAQKAVRINSYIKQWGAKGFRSGFMLRNLDWLHDLNVEYDASTFDTDPFEPQSDGVESIFPFWVQRTSNSGYVELPYTLPQDSTLFLLLQEKNADIWIKKLDWIAQSGGMALINVHPDYVRFDGDPVRPRTYPVKFYKRLLDHIRAKYRDQVWCPLPCEMAAFVREIKPRLQKHQKRVCIVGPLFYESDNRTMRYAEALQKEGNHVDVICVRKPGEPVRKWIRGVNVHAIRVRERNEKGKLSYLWRLVAFTVHAGYHLTRLHLRSRYHLIHAHSIPDYIVFSALVPKLTGTKVILDIYDVTPEFYLSKFQANPSKLTFKALLMMERASCSFADHVISANDLWHQKLTMRSVEPSKCTPFVNYVDLKIFYPHQRLRKDDRFIVVYPGILNWHQGVDLSIRAFSIFSQCVPNSEFHIYGEGPEKESLLKLIDELDLNHCVFIKEPVVLSAIPQIIADADMGVVGKRANIFGNEAFSTKITEYMSQGIPTVIPRTAIDSHYFSSSEVMFFEPGNYEDMADKMLETVNRHGLRDRLVSNSFKYLEENNWDKKAPEYMQLVNRLMHMNSP